MSIVTFQGVVENGQIRLSGNVSLPERTTVYVVVPDVGELQGESRFDLAEMISRMPADYRAAEEGFGKPIGKEEWKL